MKNVLTFASLLLSSIFVVSCGNPIHTIPDEQATSAPSNSLPQATAVKAQDKILDCIMELINVIASGKDDSLSLSCTKMIQTLQQNREKNAEKENLQVTTSGKDLQNELRDLTLPQRSFQSNFNFDNEESVSDLKRDPGFSRASDLSDGAQEDIGVESNDSFVDEGVSLNEPFVTTLKSIDDNYLVIPLKYFEKQLMKSMTQSADAETNSPVRELLEEAGNDELYEDNQESFQDEVVNPTFDVPLLQESLSREGSEEIEHKITRDELDALYRVELDINRLNTDLGELKDQETNRKNL